MYVVRKCIYESVGTGEVHQQGEEKKKRNETVNDKLWSLETTMDTTSRDQAESACAIQSKLDALLRNSFN